MQKEAAGGPGIAGRLHHRRLRGDEKGGQSQQRHHLHVRPDPPVHPPPVYGPGEKGSAGTLLPEELGPAALRLSRPPCDKVLTVQVVTITWPTAV